jgi:pyruvate/2-oxoglutarate dehydrogenase complex dihydrolipoamide dehydrogenase (E3) component
VPTIVAEAPDAVIVATGATPRRPDLPGGELPGVATVEDVLLAPALAGARCLVVDATGRIQAGLAADLLGQQGREVTLVTPYHTVCDNTEPSTKEPLLERLYQASVTMVPDAILTGIERADPGGRRGSATSTRAPLVGGRLRHHRPAYGRRAVDTSTAP